jgi:anti-sigma B factor antagonist
MTLVQSGTDLIPTAHCDGDAMMASLRGEIDLHNSSELRDAMLGVLLKPAPRKLVLDMAQVPYMDSSGLAVLVEGLRTLQRVGGRIFLLNLQSRVRGLLDKKWLAFGTAAKRRSACRRRLLFRLYSPSRFAPTKLIAA